MNPLRDQAIAKRLEAEASQAEAEAEKARAEAKKASLEADLVSFDVAAKRRETEEKLAGDHFHRTIFFQGAVTPSSVQTCMNQLGAWHRMYPGQSFTIVMNSPGGDVVDGMALFDHIRWLEQKGHEITIVVRGMAASMAGILLQAASKRIVGAEAWVLIHRAAFGSMGKTFEVEDKVKWVKRVEDRIIDIFVQRCRKAAEAGTAEQPLTKQKITKNWERTDWWLTAEECIKYGVADEID